ncbi:MAG: CopG family transcriptional regulator [Deferribacteres bacterium]|nr:CopG family transcriptional regulator [Deferribacteres bacterium]
MTKVEIPESLYAEIEGRVKESSEFESVEEYITFVLEEILKDEEEPEEHTLSEEDEEKVKERLRGLGYL